MKNKLLAMAIIIMLIFITGCDNGLSDTVNDSCQKTITELKYYLDGKIDAEELHNHVDKYASECSPNEDIVDEVIVCSSIRTISTSAYLANFKGEKNYVGFEEQMNNLQKECN